MPKPPPNKNRPSALEMFTDRVLEQELLSRLMAHYQDVSPPSKNEFITVFYGVGGVGKTTLCSKAMKTASGVKSSVAVAILNLDSENWSSSSSFAHFLLALLPELNKCGIPCSLTQVLLLMHSQVDAKAHLPKNSSELWVGAIGLLDQATQAVGIPGVGLLVQGAQWLKDRKKQADVSRQLRELGLWPEETEGGRINLLDLEEKLAHAFCEDLKQWAVEGKGLRILLDGFERIQSRESRRDCQQLLQKWAGYLAADEEQSLIGRVRLLIFGRDKLKWDELYDDANWLEYYTQHLLEGLGEADALDFIEKYTQWLQAHNQSKAASAIKEHTNAILDAADEAGRAGRSIYPYYLDLAVGMVHDGTNQNKIPDLGRTPGELQDRFFRYLKPEELHLLKILALAEKFDADLFDALVREHRVAGFAVGTFTTTVVDGRSYVSESGPGFYRFHRLMAKALQDQWLKTDAVRQQGGEAVRWIFGYFTSKIVDIPRKDWGDAELEKWRHGMAVIIPQHDCRRQLISFEELEKILRSEHWEITYPVSLKEQIDIAGESFRLLTESPACPIHIRLHSGRKVARLLLSANKQSEAVGLARSLLSSAKQLLGDEESQTLKCFELLVECLMEDTPTPFDYKDREAELVLLQRTIIGLNEKINGIDHPKTLWAIAKITSLPFAFGLPREDSNSLESEFFKRAEALFEREAVNNQDHNAGITAILIFAEAHYVQGRYRDSIDMCQWILDPNLQLKISNDDLLTALSIQSQGLLSMHSDIDWPDWAQRREISDNKERVSHNNRRVFDLCVEMYGMRHPKTAFAFRKWMQTQASDMVKCDFAESRRLISAFETIFGKYHPDLIKILQAASRVETKAEEQRSMLEDIVQRCEIVYGENSEKHIISINNFARFLHENNDTNEACSILRKLIFLLESADTVKSQIEIISGVNLYIAILESANNNREIDWIHEILFENKCKKGFTVNFGPEAEMRCKLARHLARHGRSSEAKQLLNGILIKNKETVRIDCLADEVTDETKECLLKWLNEYSSDKTMFGEPRIPFSDDLLQGLRFNKLIDDILSDADFDRIHKFVKGLRTRPLECSNDLARPDANAMIQLPSGVEIPASGSSLVAPLPGEVLAEFCGLVNTSANSLSSIAEISSQEACSPIATKLLDPDQTRQVENLREIMSTARFSPSFKRNPKYPGLERPRISYGDVMGNRLIIRDDFSDGFNQYWDDSEAPLVKKYDSEEELAQDGWRLD
jgi:hypothetical protein